jgi:hypothetical protein
MSKLVATTVVALLMYWMISLAIGEQVPDCNEVPPFTYTLDFQFADGAQVAGDPTVELVADDGSGRVQVIYLYASQAWSVEVVEVDADMSAECIEAVESLADGVKNVLNGEPSGIGLHGPVAPWLNAVRRFQQSR